MSHSFRARRAGEPGVTAVRWLASVMKWLSAPRGDLSGGRPHCWHRPLTSEPGGHPDTNREYWRAVRQVIDIRSCLKRATPAGTAGCGRQRHLTGRCRPGRGGCYLPFLPFLPPSCSSWPRVSPRSRLGGQRFVDEGVNVSLTSARCRYAVTVAPRSQVRRITAALSALDAADGPVSRLHAARRLREAAEELEAAQVAAARKAGATWIEIGACYGLSKQGAQQRFRAARNQAKTSAAAPDKKKAGPPS